MLAALVVHLKANYGNLQAGLATSRNLVANTARSITGSLRSVGGQIAGLVGVAGAVAGVRHEMSRLDSVAKASIRTGFGYAELEGLGLAAGLSGSSVETLHKSLQKFSQNMGLAAAGGGPAIKALDQLGISFDAIRNASPEEQLLTVAESLKSLPNVAMQNAIAMQLFGKAGGELIPMLNEGRAGLAAFIAESKKMGLNFSTEELNNLQAANDAIDRLKTQAASAFGQIAVAVAPMVNSLSAGLNQWITDFGGVTSAVNSLRGIWTETQNGIATGMVYAMTVGEFAMANWQNIGILAVSAVSLAFVQFGAVMAHFFGAELPAWFTWFGSNWKDVFFTAVDLASTVFINLGTNIRRIMGEIWDFIASGGTDSMEMAWTPLTDGFVNSIKSLPDIPERIIGPLEQQLAGEVASLSGSLGNDLGGMLNDRLDALKSIQGQSPAAAAAGGASPGMAGAGGGSDAVGGGDSKGAGGALKKGSAEAFSAIFAAMRGGGGKEAQSLKAQQASAKAAAQTAVNTDKIATALQGGATIAVVEQL